MGTRVVAALSLFAFVLGNLGGLIHQATASHVRCPEHGEVVHADAAPVDVAADPNAAPVSIATRLQALAAGRGPAQPGVRGALPRSSSHEHDHCYISCASRERLAGVSFESPDQDAPLPARAALALDAGHQPAGGALYRTAPKTSPPA